MVPVPNQRDYEELRTIRQTGNVLHIRKALASLRYELGQINKMIEVAEAIASKEYERRVKRINGQAVSRNSSQNGPSACNFIPPRSLDPDATLWLN